MLIAQLTRLHSMTLGIEIHYNYVNYIVKAVP